MDILSRIKKSVASVALSAMSFALVMPLVNAADLNFTDANEIPSWANEAISALMDQGVLKGNDDGSFAPNRQLNRAEVSKIIVLATGVDVDTSGGPHFPDVTADQWYYDYIETMYNHGWINGYPDGLFRPAVGINRAEIGKMVVNAFQLEQDLTGAPHFSDVKESDWFYGYVETAYNAGLMRGYGDGTFGPANAVTRAETATIVYDAQVGSMTPTGPAIGTLEVTLSDQTPRGTNIPYNATSVPFTTLELTASDDADIEISALTFTRLGLGDNEDFKNVWLEIDGFKVGNDKSINNDDIVELRFNPPVVVPAGMTLLADVVGSMKYTVASGDTCNSSGSRCNIGHYNRFALVSKDDITSTAANISGDFPIEGEEMGISSYQVSELQFNYLGSDTTVDVGDNFIEIGKFRLLNNSTTNKDIEIRAITFKNDGTAQLQDTLENLALYVNGEQVSAETIIDGDYATFRLDNGVTGGYVIENGNSRIFSIRADIVSAERGATINFKVDNFEDVVGIEIGTSFGVKTLTGDAGLQVNTNNNGTTAATCTAGTSDAQDDCARLRYYSIDSGDLNISRDPSSLGNQQYAPGSNDIVVLTARVVVAQPLLTDGVKVYLSSDSQAATVTPPVMATMNTKFDNYRLYLNDKLIDTQNTLEGTTTCTTNTSCYLNFATTFEIAGTSILKVVVNSKDAAVSGDKLKLMLSATDFSSVQYISTGNQVTAAQLLGSATSSFVEIAASQLTITKTDGLSAGQHIVAGVDDVTFMQFVLDNNDSGDINVSSVSIAADGTANTDATTNGVYVSGSARTYSNFTSAIFVDGTQQGSAKNLTSTGTATFNDLSVVIPSATQKEFTVVVDTIEASATVISTTINDGSISNSDTTLVLTDASDFTVGDLITIEGAGVDDTTQAITGISTNTITFTPALATATLPTTGDTVVAVHQLKLDVTAVDADNVENGTSITTNNGASAIDATTHRLEGTNFVFVPSGTLTVSNKLVNPDSRIIVAGQQDVDVMKINFSASDDEVHIKDLYLENDVSGNGTVTSSSTMVASSVGTADSNYDGFVNGYGSSAITEADASSRFSFKLYNEAGQVISTKQMTDGSLHFQLANQNRIRVPKDGSTYVTVKASANALSQSSQTGKVLKLSLDADGTDKGIQAITASTGADITTPTGGWGDAVGGHFIVYRSKITFANATNQPSLTNAAASSTGNAIYRFSVTGDAAYKTAFAKLTLNISATANVLANSTLLTNSNSLLLYRASNSSYSGGFTQVTGVTPAGTAPVATLTLSTPEEIAAGGTNYYELRTTEAVANPTGTGDKISVEFTKDTIYRSPSTAVMTGSGIGVQWSDYANNGTMGPYLNGFELTYPNNTDGSAE